MAKPTFKDIPTYRRKTKPNFTYGLTSPGTTTILYGVRISHESKTFAIFNQKPHSQKWLSARPLPYRNHKYLERIQKKTIINHIHRRKRRERSFIRHTRAQNL